MISASILEILEDLFWKKSRKLHMSAMNTKNMVSYRKAHVDTAS